MPEKKPVIDARKKRVQMLKDAKAAELFASKYRCEKCGMPVDPKEMDVCWSCGHPKAVDVTVKVEA